MTNPARQRIVIVGGGIAGLSIAHALLKRHARAGAPARGALSGDAAAMGVDVTVLERAARPGGNIRTERLDGYTCEWGPNGFLDNAPATLDLVRDLGLESRLQQSDDRARTRFIVRGGRLHGLPGGPTDALTSRLLSWRGKFRIACEPFARGRPDGDETIHAFATRRIGREAADVLIDAMVSGVFGGDARQLSLRACFPKMWQLETDHGGLFRALLARGRRPWRRGEAMGVPQGRLTSLRGGLEELVQGLVAHLVPVVRTGVDVCGVRREGSRYQLAIAGGASLAADGVVLACGSATTARMVRTLDETLADTLATIPSAGMVVVCLGYAVDRLPAPLAGFGYLIPRSEGLRTLGCVWDSSVYPGRAPAGRALMRVMLGGATDPAAVELDDAALLAIVRAELRTVMGLDAMPDFVKIVRHPTGIPQYTVGHLDRLAHAEARLTAHPGVALAGNAYRGVAINACIAEAPHVAERLLAYCARGAAAVA